MKKYILLVLITTTFLVACSKEEIGTDVSITGFVKLIDEKGAELLNKKDVAVKIAETTSLTKTDENGKFLFKGLKAGSFYVFNFSKEGFGELTSPKYQFIGNAKPGLINTVQLYEQPKIVIESSTVNYSSNSININGVISKTSSFSVKAFVNDSADVSYTHYDFQSPGMTYNGTYFTNFQVYIPLNNHTYKAGTNLFIAVYFFNLYEQGYWDPETKKYLYTGAKKAAMLKYTL